MRSFATLLLLVTTLHLALALKEDKVQVFDIHTEKPPNLIHQWLSKEFEVTQRDTSLSICLHLQLRIMFTEPTILMKINKDIMVFLSKMTIDFVTLSGFYSSGGALEFLKWSHFCLVIGQEPAIYVDGKMIKHLMSWNMTGLQNGSSTLTIGATPFDSVPGQSSSAGMKVTIPSIFQRSLTKEEVYTLASCNKTLEYDDLGKGKWRLNNASCDIHRHCPESSVLIEGYPVGSNMDNSILPEALSRHYMLVNGLTNRDVCSIHTRNYYILFGGQFTKETAETTCRAFGGTLPDPNMESLSAIKAILKSFNGNVMSHSYLNSSDSKQCHYMETRHQAAKIWMNRSCSSLGLYVFCKLPMVPTIELRFSQDQSKAFFVESFNFRPVFFSKDGYHMMPNIEDLHELVFYNKYEVEQCRTKINSYRPIGRHLWTNNETMTLTSCQKNEFTCTDGLCIDLNLRCDGVNDCQDSSDEVCYVLLPLPESYRVFQTPEEETPLEVNFTIRRFHDVDVTEGWIKIWLKISTKWSDYRVKVMQLRNGENNNMLSDEEAIAIWKPQYKLVNAIFEDDMDYRNGKKVTTHVFAVKEAAGDPTVCGGYECYVYNASTSASLKKDENFMMTYLCDFNLQYFPFDVHLCTIVIRITNLGTYKAFFQNTTLNSINFPKYIGPFEIMAILLGEDGGRRSSQGLYTIEIRMLLRRNFGAYVLTTFSPVIIIGLIGLLSYKFEAHNFTDRIMVTLTSLIVVASFFTAVSEDANTTTVRSLDIFFFYYIFRLFTMFACHTIQGIMISYKKKKMESTQMDKGRFQVDDKGKIHSVEYPESVMTPVYIPVKTSMNVRDIIKQSWVPPGTEKAKKKKPCFWEGTYDTIFFFLGLGIDCIFMAVFALLVYLASAEHDEMFNL